MTRRTIVLHIAGVPLVLGAEGPGSFLKRVRNLFPRARAARGVPDVAVRWSQGLGQVWRRGRPLRWSTDVGSILEWTEWALTDEALRRLRPRGLVLHAAWAARGRRSSLFAGPHGAGKTTLVAALARKAGWRILADDLVFLEYDGSPRPVERPLRIKPSGARMVRGWKVGMTPLKGRIAGMVRGVPDSIFLLSRPVGALVCRELSSGIAVAKLARFTQNFKDRPARALRTLARLKEGRPAHELEGGSLDDRFAAVQELARDGGSCPT